MDELYDTAFDTIREGRATESGRAMVDIAQKIFCDGEKSAEARQWLNLALKADAASTPEELVKIRKLAEKRSRGKTGIGAMRKGLAVVRSGPA
jgi:hypothetical protein